jgi:hypothetical protein
MSVVRVPVEDLYPDFEDFKFESFVNLLALLQIIAI